MSSDRGPDAEARRLEEDAAAAKNWKRWGPYLSERQWATVREDYSPDGDLLGVLSRTSTPAAAPTAGARTACSASATASAACASPWPCGTAKTRILKERLFGLTNPEGNHGEDVKEVLLLPRRHADPLLPARPSTSTRRPNSPTSRCVEENRRRGRKRTRVRADRHRRLRRRSATST